MTLKEKLTDKNLKIRQSTTELYYADKLEKIADDYAIEFYNWVVYESDGHDFISKTPKELLQIFKKEKGYGE